jgi:hypothetical protein
LNGLSAPRDRWMLIDSRLDAGFRVFGDADLRDGNGSLPQCGFKVGHTTIPEPGTGALVASIDGQATGGNH